MYTHMYTAMCINDVLVHVYECIYLCSYINTYFLLCVNDINDMVAGCLL